MSYPVAAIAPFAGLLGSIAFLPLLTPSFWHKYNNALIAFWGMLAIFFVLKHDAHGMQAISHQLFDEYAPFMTVVSCLYLVSTGITVSLSFPPRPLVTTTFLLIASFCASLLGTTGASMLFIHPLLKLIKERRYKAHIIVFFIFLVGNCGGCLTPLGDPPLLMGFLYGVPFSWPLTHLFWPFLFTISAILALFFVLELFLTRKKTFHTAKHFHLHGWIHLGLLVGLLMAFFSIGLLKPYGHLWTLAGLLTMGALTAISLKIHRKTPIHLDPVIEVAKIFIVVFLALIPINNLLNSQSALALKAFVTKDGLPNAWRYFWLTGFFSSFLDNAPTFIVFFKMIGQSLENMLHGSALKAVSLGSVFMGALTYLGNAPNLMIRSIAQDHGINMPSFLAYTFYAILVLVPVFYVMGCLFL